EKRRNEQFGENQHNAADDPGPPFDIHAFLLVAASISGLPGAVKPGCGFPQFGECLAAPTMRP
ncbi:MAG TPA: hypothetical protein VJ572_03095, partial [Azonexus sp.]|nr:hypothetical protein [Azonexus sp.]